MTRRASTHPGTILLLAAKPGDVRGEYEGKVTVHGGSSAEAERVLRDALAALSPHRTWRLDVFTYKKGDVSRRDPYRTTATSSFEGVDKAAIDEVRSRASASYVARSRKVTERELSNSIADRAPLVVPTHEMWRAALDARRGFVEAAPDWYVEKVFMGEEDPPVVVADAAYRLMSEENVRRGGLR